MTDNKDTVLLTAQQLEQLWAEHLKGEFETRDVEATLATMPTSITCRLTPAGEEKKRCVPFTAMSSFPHGLRMSR